MSNKSKVGYVSLKESVTNLPLLVVGHLTVSWSYTPSPSVAPHHIPRESPPGRLHAHGAKERNIQRQSNILNCVITDTNYSLCMTVNDNRVIIYLTLQEEEDSGFNEVRIGALSASPLGGAFLLRFPLAEQSLRVLLISWVSHKRTRT